VKRTGRFDLPLSGPFNSGSCETHSRRNRIVDPDSPWLFPSDSGSGHVVEVHVDALKRFRRACPTAHCTGRSRSRRAYRSQRLKFLLNASASRGVTMVYLHPSLEVPEGSGRRKATTRQSESA
jgi:hypothetical protein